MKPFSPSFLLADNVIFDDCRPVPKGLDLVCRAALADGSIEDVAYRRGKRVGLLHDVKDRRWARRRESCGVGGSCGDVLAHDGTREDGECFGRLVKRDCGVIRVFR